MIDSDSKWFKVAPIYLSAGSFIVSVLALAAVIGSCEVSRRSSELSAEANQISQKATEFSKEANEFSKEANEISRSALNNTIEIQNREKKNEEEYAAILYTDSIDSFRQPISYCNTVTIRLRNYTNKAKTISPHVRSNNICLHSNIGACSQECKYDLALPSFVVEPLGTYTGQIKIHTRGDFPADATIELYNNDRSLWRFSYKKDQNANIYYPN